MVSILRASPESPVAGASTAVFPNPEVLARPTRRRWSLSEKCRILTEADTCTVPGSLGALLRREGVYSSQLATWRQQRTAGLLEGAGPRRGRPALTTEAVEVARLRRENARLTRQLAIADTIIAVQKKLATLYGLPLLAEDPTPS